MVGDEKYVEFFLNSRSDAAALDLIEISHPDFSQTFYLVRNQHPGVTVTLEDASVQYFEFVPMKVTLPASSDDLDQVLKIDIGDVGEIIAPEMDRLRAAASFSIRPELIYRAYRSDDLTEPMLGPWRLEIVDLNFGSEGVSFEAKAAALNQNRTGRLYRLEDFPALRGFL